MPVSLPSHALNPQTVRAAGRAAEKFGDVGSGDETVDVVDGRRPDRYSETATLLGYSVGKWDGDVLVVDTTGFNGKPWLDGPGHPLTDALHITERFRRPDFGHLDLQLTIDDPKAYLKPWTVRMPLHLFLDGDLLEFVCNENEGDVKHMPNK